MRAFLCHNNIDFKYVFEVAKHLLRGLDGVYYFEGVRQAKVGFEKIVAEELRSCEVMVIFVGRDFTPWQADEVGAAHNLHRGGEPKHFIIVDLLGSENPVLDLPPVLTTLNTFPIISAHSETSDPRQVAAQIIRQTGRVWRASDDLPLNPSLFSYEKDIIKFYLRRSQLPEDWLTREPSDMDEMVELQAIRSKLLDGCPDAWPTVTRWNRIPELRNRLLQEDVGVWRPDGAAVLTGALSDLSLLPTVDQEGVGVLPTLTFPEAGPREHLYFPLPGHSLGVAILVSGGIAPGINAVIDGIVQRHWLYAKHHNYENRLSIFGLKNGFRAFENFTRYHWFLAAEPRHYKEDPDRRLETSKHTNEGGSILGTSRVDALSNSATSVERLQEIDRQLFRSHIDIVYIIGGDGSMKAAHALWSVAQNNAKRSEERRPLSVVAIPKTMDNDIHWMWQSFGFLSAVEKAREVIAHLSTEVRSNPRLGIVQLFGSDSGFVVSHAVLASDTGACALALIPEIRFSMRSAAAYLRRRLAQSTGSGIPYGLVVMAETAIPTDAMEYVDGIDGNPPIDVGLSEEEKQELRNFESMRNQGQRIQGQTNDTLRTAGLKIVSRGLERLLREGAHNESDQPEVLWDQLRVLTNEPRHLLRSIPPSSIDVISGHRLGTLAVDNAVAGYTDFMISQWITEYVLVPLKLVVLGRKRIPTSGIFWKSVLAKTGQPADLD